MPQLKGAGGGGGVSYLVVVNILADHSERLRLGKRARARSLGPLF